MASPPPWSDDLLGLLVAVLDAEYTPFKRSNINSSFPDRLRCVGSTDSWLALDYADDKNKIHTYFLHNPFSKEVVALPELDAIVGEVFNIKSKTQSRPVERSVDSRWSTWIFPPS
uniref:KIB1-4 beta-propeller domain-containing protein n=1 Tax=Aegilops tauschii TaxID=37682 RepID=M8BLL6_AEGTA